MSDLRCTLRVKLSALFSGMDVEDEVAQGFNLKYGVKWWGPTGRVETGRGAGLKRETKIFIYSFSKCLLSPYHVLGTVLSLRNTALNKLD